MRNIVSLFDGMSCGQISINKYLSESEYKWFASEIHYPSMNVTNKNFPKTVQLGDVSKITRMMLPEDIFMVMGGSPCQGFSMAGRRKGMVTVENIEVTSLFQYMNLKESGFEFEGQSYLFWEFIRVIKMTKPKYFLLENVLMTGKNKRWERIISKELGVEPIHINSNLVTAQNRDRLYWTNIPGVTLPENTYTHLSEVVPGAIGGWGKRGRWSNTDNKYNLYATTRKDGKSNCLTKSSCGRFVELNDGSVLPLTINQCEVLQGVQENYTEALGVTMTDRYQMLGNGWTIPVIEHIFSFIPEFHLEYNNKGVILAETI
jgi:site-specific DNA-cytosine methylase